MDEARDYLTTAADRQALGTLDGTLLDMATCEICARTGLDVHQVKAAKRRVLRKLGSLARL